MCRPIFFFFLTILPGSVHVCEQEPGIKVTQCYQGREEVQEVSRENNCQGKSYT